MTVALLTQVIVLQDWEQRTIKQRIKLGQSGLLPLEVRFLHNPDSAHGFCGAALSSNIIHFTKVAALAHVT